MITKDDELTITVTDYERGGPRGADDRDIREVVLEFGDKRKVFRFSANWDPHNFRVEPDERGWFDAILVYWCAGEERGQCFDWD